MLNFHFQSIVDRIWFRNLFHSQQHDCLFSPQMSLSLLSLCQSCRSLGSDSSPFFPRRRVHYSTCLLPLKQLLLVLQVPSLSSLPPLRGWGARTPCRMPERAKGKEEKDGFSWNHEGDLSHVQYFKLNKAFHYSTVWSRPANSRERETEKPKGVGAFWFESLIVLRCKRDHEERGLI